MSTICASRSTRPTKVRPPCSKVPSLKVTAPACARRPAEAITATAPATTNAPNVRLIPILSSIIKGYADSSGPPRGGRYRWSPASPGPRTFLLLRLQFRRRGLGEPRRVDRHVGLHLRELQRHLHVGLRQRSRERDLDAEARQLTVIGVINLRRHERDRRDREAQQPHEQAARGIEEQLRDAVAVDRRLQDDDVLVVEDGVAGAPLWIRLLQAEREVRQRRQA